MRPIAILLSLCLGFSPALGLAAEAAALSPTAQTDAAAAPEPPKLPVDADSVSPTAEPVLQGDVPAAQPATPKEDPAKLAPGKAVADEPPAKFRFGNFALGFLGGALLGGAYGVLSSGGKDSATMTQNAAIYAGAAGVALGGLGLLLGATTPEEAKPPKVEGRARPWPLFALALRF